MSAMEKFDLCYRYLHVHLKFNTLVGLPFFVNRDFNPGNRLAAGLSYFYQYILDFWVFLGFISGIIAPAVVWNDVNILFGCLSSTTHVTQTMGKVFLFNWKRKKFLEQLKRLNDIFDRNESLKIDGGVPDFAQFASTSFRYLNVLEFVVMTVVTFWTSLYFVPATYNSFKFDGRDGAHIPIVGYFPFDYTSSPRFQIVVIFQTILFYVANLKTVVIDYFVLGFIFIHVLQFRYLNLTLERATLLLIDRQQENDEEAESRINSFLVNWIKQHQDTVSAVKYSADLLSFYFLIEFGYIVIHTSVPAFVITSTLSWDLNQKIVLVFMCSSAILNLYLLALSGDLFNESNEQFAITFYGPHLFGKNRSYQLMYRMMLHAGRNRSKVFGFAVYPLCSVTFGAIMRTIMSYYLALNQIKGFKNEE